MTTGRAYVWSANPARALGGSLAIADVRLQRLDQPGTGLRGRYVDVRNGGVLYEPAPATGAPRHRPLGSARPDANGNFLFDHGRGGGRIDKYARTAEFRQRYVEAARFGEVNTYFHLDRIAAYLDELLRELDAPPLPRVIAVVNAHHGAVDRGDGLRDGRILRGRWRPFQGGHYRLPARRYEVAEYDALAATGEIHLGPGRKLLTHGALVECAGRSYRANASHNPGIIYHEYGHHLTRHTADFRANSLKRADQQNNRKTAMDEGTCDYWTAVMLESPNIWACHRRHDESVTHPRSLASVKVMADYDAAPNADPHANGTIWGAALWDLRARLTAADRDGARGADLLVVAALCEIGRLGLDDPRPRVAPVRQARLRFGSGLASLLAADDKLTGGRRHDSIIACLGARGIELPNGAATTGAGNRSR